MANPLLETFDTNDTNTKPLTATKKTDGFLVGETVESAVHNEMFKQLFAAANKNKNDGVWEWDANLTYNKGSMVSYLGEIYQSLVDANTITPINDLTNWTNTADGSLNNVKLTGDQTVAGIKTFASSPVAPTLPAGTNTTQLATTEFVNLNLNGHDASTLDGIDSTQFLRSDVSLLGFQTNGRHQGYSGDLNAITSNSIYNFSIVSVTNYPPSMPAWGFCHTMVYVTGTDYATQVVYDMNGVNGASWQRQKINGTWLEWTNQGINSTGLAPNYACRAWVNFNGTGTVAIRASGNVSSITDNGTGNYTVNFTTAMIDTNYGFTFMHDRAVISSADQWFWCSNITINAITCNIYQGTSRDTTNISVQIFR